MSVCVSERGLGQFGEGLVAPMKTTIDTVRGMSGGRKKRNISSYSSSFSSSFFRFVFLFLILLMLLFFPLLFSFPSSLSSPCPHFDIFSLSSSSLLVDALQGGLRALRADPWKLARAIWNPNDSLLKQVGASTPFFNTIGESHKDQSLQQLMTQPPGVPFGYPMPLGVFP